jgi:hypothetical protein
MVKYWCESCLCFVESSHRCEAWPTVTAISRDIIEAIRAEAKAEALREAVNLVKLIRSADCFDELTDDKLRAAIMQEPQP